MSTSPHALLISPNGLLYPVSFVRVTMRCVPASRKPMLLLKHLLICSVAVALLTLAKASVPLLVSFSLSPD